MRMFLLFVSVAILAACSDIVLDESIYYYSSSSQEEPSSSSQESSSSSQEESSSSSQESSSSSQEPSSSSSVYWNTGISYGTLTDERDGKTYRTVEMPDGKTWMAENLNYGVTDSKCYGNLESNCDIYGRLYNRNTAIAVCPSGWHLPSDPEWTTLTTAIGGESTGGERLKSNSELWNTTNAGTDQYGFSILPGGYYKESSYNNIGNEAYFWTATLYSTNAYIRYLYHDDIAIFKATKIKGSFYSVRCLKNPQQ